MRAGDTITDSFRYLGLRVKCDAWPSSIIKPRGRRLEPVKRWQARVNDARSQVSRATRLPQSRKLCFIGIHQRYNTFLLPLLGLLSFFHSPCGDVRGKADHKRADEGADLLSGPQPPSLLLVQAFLPHTGKTTQARHILWLALLAEDRPRQNETFRSGNRCTASSSEAIAVSPLRGNWHKAPILIMRIGAI